jgi:hypothetical protein
LQSQVFNLINELCKGCDDDYVKHVDRIIEHNKSASTREPRGTLIATMLGPIAPNSKKGKAQTKASGGSASASDECMETMVQSARESMCISGEFIVLLCMALYGFVSFVWLCM